LLVAAAAGGLVGAAAGAAVGALIDGPDEVHAASSEAIAPPDRPIAAHFRTDRRLNLSTGGCMALRGSFEGSLGQDLRQVLFVFCATAQVTGRVESLGGLFGSLGCGRARGQRLLDPARAY
jgi:hypothetical protein